MTLVADRIRTEHPDLTLNQVKLVTRHAAAEAVDEADVEKHLSWLEYALSHPVDIFDFYEVVQQMENVLHAEEDDLELHFGKPNTALVRQDLVEHYHSELNAAVNSLASIITGRVR